MSHDQGWLCVCSIAALLAAPVCLVSAADAPADEAKKIDALIAHVEGLKDAKFVRNGIEYDAKTAAAFLRGKRDARKSKIKTAADFIEHVATKSSTSGKPYLIRFKDGKEEKSGQYLTEQLERLQSPPE